METFIGSTSEKIAKKRKSQTKVYSLDELSDEQKKNLTLAQELLIIAMKNKGHDETLVQKCTIVDFQDSNLFGMFLPNENRYCLASSILSNFGKTISVMIHELSHFAGKDGQKSHEEMKEHLSEVIFNYLYTGEIG